MACDPVGGSGGISDQSSSGPERIICIHGTGAGTPDPVAPRWWQRESEFCGALARALGSGFALEEPFLWSGRNLESDRRQAGEALAMRLAALEQSGTAYHLIGHSHGGSVVWHALGHSAAQRGRLAGLKSWTTIGTPFLHFQPVKPYAAIARLAILFIVLGALYWAAAGLVADYQSVWRNANLIAVAAAAGVLVVLVATFVVALWQSAVLAVLWRRRRQRDANAATAASWYGPLWLGLWHRSDEAIAALEASLARPFTLAPRPDPKSALTIWRPLLRLYGLTFARAGDEYAWSLLTRKIQGSDLFGQEMVTATPFPPALAPGWSAVPDGIERAILVAADGKAAAFLTDVRTKLQAIATTEESEQAASIVAAGLTWKEVIHTTYFDNADIGRLVACQIAPPAAAEAADAVEAWRRARPQAAPTQPRKPFAPAALLTLRTGGFAIYCAALAVAIAVLADAYLLPNTEDYVVGAIAAAIERPEFNYSENSGYFISDIRMKLAALAGDGLAPPTQLKQAHDDLGTLQYYAYQLGRSHDAARFNALLPLFGPNNGRPDAGRMYFALGQIDGRTVPDAALAAQIWQSAMALMAQQKRIAAGNPFTSPGGNRPTPVPLNVAYDFAVVSLAGGTDAIAPAVDLMIANNHDVCAVAPPQGYPGKLSFANRLARFGALAGLQALPPRCTNSAAVAKLISAAAWTAAIGCQSPTNAEACHADVERALAAVLPATAPPDDDSDIGDATWQTALVLAEGGAPGYASWSDALLRYWTDMGDVLSNDATRWDTARLVRALLKIDPARARTMFDGMLAALTKALLADWTVFSDGIPEVDQIEKLYRAIGQDPQALTPLADKFAAAAADAPEHPVLVVNRAALAAALYAAAGQPAKAHPLVVQALTLGVVTNPTSEIDTLLDLGLRLGAPRPPLPALESQAIQNQTSSNTLVKQYAAMARAFAENGFFFEAKQMADATLDTPTKLACYALIVDRYVKKHDPDAWRRLHIPADTFVFAHRSCGSRDDLTQPGS